MTLAVLLLLAAEPAPLTMEDAVNRALANHPSVHAARASLAVSAAQFDLAGAWPAPQFRWSTANFDFDPLTVEERNTTGLRFSPPRPREFALKRQLALTRRQGVESEIRSAEARLAAQVRLVYRQAAIAGERERLARRVAELRRNLKTTVLRQVAVGLKEASESDLADLAASEAEGDLRRAADQAESALRKLARLISKSGAVDFTLAADPSLVASTPPAPDRAGLIARAVRSRGDVAQLAATCRQYQASEALARDQRYPWIGFVQLSRRTTTILDRGAWSFQVGVDLPLFRSSASGEAKLAAAQRQRCGLEQSALARQVEDEIDEAIARLDSARAELGEIERLRAGAAERALERARGALASGRADLVDVASAEARVLGLQDRWLQRRLDYAALQAQLESAVGAEMR